MRRIARWIGAGLWLLAAGLLQAAWAQPKPLELWAINDAFLDGFFPNFIKQWNSRYPQAPIRLVQFENDTYKQRIFVALGAKNGPDLFFNWGGGVLESYVKGGAVEDLTRYVDQAWRRRFLDFTWQAVTFGNRVYGVPSTPLTPEVWLYNRQVFDRLGLKPPETWGELLGLVDRLKAAGVIPIVLAGGSKWPLLMYQQYLASRVGGPEVFENIVANRPNAWRHPAVLRSAELIVQLVDKNPFQPGWESAQYGSGTARALFASGRAAMQLMGIWEFPPLLNEHPEFIRGGGLGWFAFPKVEGGKGDPKGIVGVYTNYFSVTSFSRDKQSAVRFLRELSFSSDYVSYMLKVGSIPPFRGLGERVEREGAYPEWQGSLYRLIEAAPSYELVLDQAMPPQLAQPYLDNLQLLFLKRITPQEFSDRMQKLADELRR